MCDTSSEMIRRFSPASSSDHVRQVSSTFRSIPISKRKEMHASPFPLSRGIHGSDEYSSILWIGRVSRPKSRRSVEACRTPAAMPSSRIVRLNPRSRRNSWSWTSPTAPTTATAARSVFRGSSGFATVYARPAPLTPSQPWPPRRGPGQVRLQQLRRAAVPRERDEAPPAPPRNLSRGGHVVVRDDRVQPVHEVELARPEVHEPRDGRGLPREH